MDLGKALSKEWKLRYLKSKLPINKPVNRSKHYFIFTFRTTHNVVKQILEVYLTVQNEKNQICRLVCNSSRVAL